MKSLLFKQPIWQGKQKALATYGEAVTRRLNGLQEINKEPEKWGNPERWHLDSKGNRQWIFSKVSSDGQGTICHVVKTPFKSGEIVYLREVFATLFVYDGLKVGDLEPNTPIWVKDTDVDKPTGCGDDKGRWRSPYEMSATLARIYLRIKDVRPERLEINKLSVQEIELEGGETALKFLKDYDGLWVWRISFEQAIQDGK